MKSIFFFVFLFVLFLTACNNSDKQASENKSDNDIDAARNFLQAALEGDYQNASRYMLQDSTNLEYLDVTKRNYKGLGPDEKRNLREASLRFFDTRKVNDSITITVFANSYRNDKDTLKLVKQGDRWLVDLKYLFEHDRDTLFNQPPNKIDTIHQ